MQLKEIQILATILPHTEGLLFLADCFRRSRVWSDRRRAVGLGQTQAHDKALHTMLGVVILKPQGRAHSMCRTSAQYRLPSLVPVPQFRAYAPVPQNKLIRGTLSMQLFVQRHETQMLNLVDHGVAVRT